MSNSSSPAGHKDPLEALQAGSGLSPPATELLQCWPNLHAQAAHATPLGQHRVHSATIYGLD